MDWRRDGSDWPNAGASRFIDFAPHRWHVQEAGEGPTVLLLHGAFGATQSWRHLFPLLAQHYHVVAPDLPGQGFSRCGARNRLSVGLLARDLAALAGNQCWEPQFIVGHSAGAVLALELSRHLHPKGLIGLNAALGKFDGVAGWLFPLAARLMAVNPLAAPLLARMPNPKRRMQEMLAATGSRVDGRMVDLYARLASDRAHMSGTIAMMAAWNIDAVRSKLPSIETPCLFLVGESDKTVAPRVSEDAAHIMPCAEYRELPGLGHLMHEEAAETVAGAIGDFISRTSENSHKTAV